MISRESGLLLHQVSIPTDSKRQTEMHDGDLISSMLTAIQSFVHDSFGLKADESLETIRVGELHVFIKQSKDLVLAAVVVGIVPGDLGDSLEAAVELLQQQYGKALKDFALTGDASVFEGSDPVLKSCLKANFTKPASKPKPQLKLIFFIVALACLSLVGLEIYRSLNWSNYLNDLARQPGIMITESSRRFNRYELGGLRDPLASGPTPSSNNII
ncbi:MAG: hypothetical protein R2865_12135 [Deinococcales bacterium]